MEGLGSAQNVVELGAHKYGVVPQPHALILRKFPKILQEVQEMAPDADLNSSESLITSLGDRVHSVLRIFIPDLMPAYEFAGFATKDEMERDAFDEAYAILHAPTLPQIFLAFDTAIAVNGGKRLMNMLGNALGPEVSRALRSYVVMMLRARLSEMSPNLQLTPGASGQTSSGPSVPTPDTLESVG